MSKINKKSFFRLVHLQAVAFLIIYNLLSKTVLIKSIISSNIFINFLGPYIFGVLAGVVFLYLLSHEDFFHFMKEIEKKEEKNEKRLLKKYLHHGKIIAVIVITILGGPIMGAITIRLILPYLKYPQILLGLANIPSTLLTVAIAKGIIVTLI